MKKMKKAKKPYYVVNYSYGKLGEVEFQEFIIEDMDLMEARNKAFEKAREVENSLTWDNPSLAAIPELLPHLVTFSLDITFVDSDGNENRLTSEDILESFENLDFESKYFLDNNLIPDNDENILNLYLKKDNPRKDGMRMDKPHGRTSLNDFYEFKAVASNFITLYRGYH